APASPASDIAARCRAAAVLDRLCQSADGRVRQDLLERQPQLAAPIGVLVDGARQIDLLDLAEQVLELHQQKARTGAGEKPVGGDGQGHRTVRRYLVQQSRRLGRQPAFAAKRLGQLL